MDKPKKQRTRLNPEARKSMIMDHAAMLITDEGVSAVTVERLGISAGISKALLYNYFSSITELLSQLLDREYRHLRRKQYDAAQSSETFEELVQSVTHVYISYIKERGLLLERLAMDPTVTKDSDPTQYSRDGAVMYIAELVKENFDIDIETARTIVDISYGIPAAAGRFLIHNEADPEKIEKITSMMILGSLEAVKNNYRTSLKPLRKPDPRGS